MKIFEPLGIHETGQRQNNEDYIFPPNGELRDNQDFFVVCDGVGGSEKGEVASQLTCQSVANYLLKNPVDIPRQDYLKQMLTYCEDAFETYFAKHPEAKGMGTTLTFLKLHDCGATVGHVGDSRVYHIRDGQIKYKTSDHSMVNEMMKAGLLTPEEAKDSLQKNVITRAVQGPHKRTRIDVKEISDVKAGDYFFLCTDGITEGHSDFQLEQVFSKNNSNIDKIEAIKATCSENSKDNFSAYLVEVESHTPKKAKIKALQFGVEKTDVVEVEAKSTATQLGVTKQEIIPEITEVEVDIVEPKPVDDEPAIEEKPSIVNYLLRKVTKKFLWMVVLIITVCCFAFLYLGGDGRAKNKKHAESMKVNRTRHSNNNQNNLSDRVQQDKQPSEPNSGKVKDEKKRFLRDKVLEKMRGNKDENSSSSN